MYARIGIPVDLEHPETLGKAVDAAAALAATFGAELHMVAVTSPSPSAVAHDVRGFGEALEAFAGRAGERTGGRFATHVRVSDDPAVDLHRELDDVFHELAVDLVVVASHVPGFREYVFTSHGGWLASHTDLSVFVVR